MTRKTTLTIAILLAAAACGGAGGDTTAPQNSSGNPPPTGGTPSANTVSLSGETFNPTAVTVSAGTTVKWKWENCSSDPTGGYGGGYGGVTDCASHNVTFDDGSGASPTQTSGDYSRTFSTAGTYKYHCTMHSGMTGEIVVK